MDNLRTFHEFLSIADLTPDDRGVIYIKAREIKGKKHMIFKVK